MFRAKFAYETIVHANRFFMPIDFLLSCIDPWATAPALAMMQLARFQEFKVSSTLGQVLFETVDKFILDGHAQMPFAGVNCVATERRCTPFKAFLTISGSSRSAWSARATAVAIEDMASVQGRYNP
jgi:hypothetical protein